MARTLPTMALALTLALALIAPARAATYIGYSTNHKATYSQPGCNPADIETYPNFMAKCGACQPTQSGSYLYECSLATPVSAKPRYYTSADCTGASQLGPELTNCTTGEFAPFELGDQDVIAVEYCGGQTPFTYYYTPINKCVESTSPSGTVRLKYTCVDGAFTYNTNAMTPTSCSGQTSSLTIAQPGCSNNLDYKCPPAATLAPSAAPTVLGNDTSSPTPFPTFNSAGSSSNTLASAYVALAATCLSLLRAR